MKKITFITIFSLLGIVLTGSALAATFSFSPASVDVTQGESFNLTVAINPQGVKNYTTKLELNYPADLLEIKSFSFSNSWMPLSQSGYDLLDNTNGILIKTAGYPGGLSSSATFGTVSFSAKKTGSGAITLGDNSLSLDAENQDVLSGNPQTSVNIKTVPQAVSEPAATQTTSEQGEPAEEVIPEETTPEDEATIGWEQPTELPQEQPVQSSFMAGIISLITLGTNNKLVGAIVLLILIVLVYFVIRKVCCKKQ